MNFDLSLFEKALWFSLAALGFAVYFNVPKRTIIVTMILASMGGLCKLGLMELGLNVILASLVGASIIGILAIQAAHSLHAPHFVFSIAAVIPMVPGGYTYRTMMGLIELSNNRPESEQLVLLTTTVHNGLTAAFITMALAVGVAVPMLATRRSSGKHIRLIKHQS